MMAPADARVPAPPSVPQGDLAKVLGDTVKDTADDESSTSADADRFELLGIVAQPSRSEAHAGLALLKVDNGVARTWRTGEPVTEEWVLHAIHQRSILLKHREGDDTLEVTLPDPSHAPSMANTGGSPGAGRRTQTPRIVGTPKPGSVGGRPAMSPRQRTETSAPPEEEDNTDDDA